MQKVPCKQSKVSGQTRLPLCITYTLPSNRMAPLCFLFELLKPESYT